MKTLFIFILMSHSISMYAQKSIFVRVYDLSGNKINKGRVLAVTDTSIQLKGNTSTIKISVRSIGSVKTKHSDGNNVLVGSIVGGTLLAIVGVATSSPDAGFLAYNAGEGAAGGVLLGAPLGAVIGGLTIPFKNSKTYSIDGDLTKWKQFQLIVTGNSAK